VAPAAGDEPRRPEAKAFVHDAVEIPHRLQRVHRGGRRAEDLVDFRSRLVDNTGFVQQRAHRHPRAPLVV